MWLLGKVTRAPGDGFVPSGSRAERAPCGGATLILYQRRRRRHEPVMNMCHFTRRTLGGLAAQAWKIECLGLMILKMIESRLEMASPARPAEMETYLTAICPGSAPTCPPPHLPFAAEAHVADPESWSYLPLLEMIQIGIGRFVNRKTEHQK